MSEAADELDAAVEYLEARREGSGRSLLEDFDRKLDQILMFPTAVHWSRMRRTST